MIPLLAPAPVRKTDLLLAKVFFGKDESGARPNVKQRTSVYMCLLDGRSSALTWS